MTSTNIPAPVFLDTNILIRATIVSAPLHTELRDALTNLWNAGTDLWISRQILREYLAVVTRKQTFINPLNAADAVTHIRLFATQFSIAEDSARVTEELLNLMQTEPTGGKQIHDANIVATMPVYRIQNLFTLNREDFKRFLPQINLLSMEDVQASSE